MASLTTPNARLAAALRGDLSDTLLSEVELALREGADPNLIIEDSSSPFLRASALILALDFDRVDVASLLLDHGADPSRLSKDLSWSPLMWACVSSNPAMSSIVERLLQRGADPNETDSDGASALLMACKSGHARSIEALLSAGADPLHRDDSGWGAFHHLAMFGHHALMDALHRAGADLNLLDRERRLTPLHLAAQLPSREIVEKFLSLGAEVDWPESEALRLSFDHSARIGPHGGWLPARVEAIRRAPREREALEQACQKASPSSTEASVLGPRRASTPRGSL